MNARCFAHTKADHLVIEIEIQGRKMYHVIKNKEARKALDEGKRLAEKEEAPPHLRKIIK